MLPPGGVSVYLEGEGVFPWGPGSIFLPHLVSPLNWLHFFCWKGYDFPFILFIFMVTIAHTSICMWNNTEKICDYLMIRQVCEYTYLYVCNHENMFAYLDEHIYEWVWIKACEWTYMDIHKKASAIDINKFVNIAVRNLQMYILCLYIFTCICIYLAHLCTKLVTCIKYIYLHLLEWISMWVCDLCFVYEYRNAHIQN